MPELLNYTPFPNFRYYSSDNRGREFGVVIVKATYAIEADGRLAVAEEQAPLVFDDTCHGADNETSLRLPSDLVPHKPRTDLIVDAVARAPGGEPKRSWTCGIAVEGAAGLVLAKSLRVTGPREWRPRWRRRLSAEEARDWRAHRRLFAGWDLSEPEPASEVPLRYELAYGGTVAAGEDEAGRPRFVCEVRNPIGRGLIDPDWTDHGQAGLRRRSRPRAILSPIRAGPTRPRASGRSRRPGSRGCRSGAPTTSTGSTTSGRTGPRITTSPSTTAPIPT